MTEQQRYIGDGVYASLDPGLMIILRTERGSYIMEQHWIALEPEVLHELVLFACDVGWRGVIEQALGKRKPPTWESKSQAGD